MIGRRIKKDKFKHTFEPEEKNESTKSILKRIEQKIDDLIKKDEEVHKSLPPQPGEEIKDVETLKGLYASTPEEEMLSYEIEHAEAKSEGITYSKELYERAFPKHKK